MSLLCLVAKSGAFNVAHYLVHPTVQPEITIPDKICLGTSTITSKLILYYPFVLSFFFCLVFAFLENLVSRLKQHQYWKNSSVLNPGGLWKYHLVLTLWPLHSSLNDHDVIVVSIYHDVISPLDSVWPLPYIISERMEIIITVGGPRPRINMDASKVGAIVGLWLTALTRATRFW